MWENQVKFSGWHTQQGEIRKGDDFLIRVAYLFERHSDREMKREQ